MALDRVHVEYVAQLARLKLSDEEISALTHSLIKTLEHIKTLDEVNTENVEPTYRVVPTQNVVREDNVVQQEGNPSLFENAPHTKGNFVKVPKIIDV